MATPLGSCERLGTAAPPSSTPSDRSRSSTVRGSASSARAMSRPKARKSPRRPRRSAVETGWNVISGASAGVDRFALEATLESGGAYGAFLADALAARHARARAPRRDRQGSALPRHALPTVGRLLRRQREGSQQADLRRERDDPRRRGRRATRTQLWPARPKPWSATTATSRSGPAPAADPATSRSPPSAQPRSPTSTRSGTSQPRFRATSRRRGAPRRRSRR